MQIELGNVLIDHLCMPEVSNGEMFIGVPVKIDSQQNHCRHLRVVAL